MSRPRARVLGVVVLACALAENGCFPSTQAKPAPASLQQRRGPSGAPAFTALALAARVEGFADEYTTVVAEACDALMDASATPRQRALALDRKVSTASAAYAIATEPNPEVALVDMVVNVSLLRAVWAGGAASRAFGARGAVLVRAYDALHRDVWALAAEVCTPAQLGAIHEAIDRWLAENPSRRYAGLVRLPALAHYRLQPLEDIGTPRSGILGPVEAMAGTTDQLRLLGERGLFLTQRLPMLARWQAELTYQETLLDPQTQRLLRDVDTLARAADRGSAALAQLGTPEGTARTAELLSRANDTLATLDRVVASLDRLLLRFSAPPGREQAPASPAEAPRNGTSSTAPPARAPNGPRPKEPPAQGQHGVGPRGALDGASDVRLVVDTEPRATLPPSEDEPPPGRVDVDAYRALVEQLGVAADKMARLVADLDTLLSSPATTNGLDRLDAAEQRAAALGDRLLDRAFWRALLLIVVFFLLLTGYRIFSVRLGRQTPA